MIVPAAMYVETAVDMLKTHDPDHLIRQRQEFVDALGEDVATEDMCKGYALGLETARALLAENPKAVFAGIEI